MAVLAMLRMRPSRLLPPASLLNPRRSVTHKLFIGGLSYFTSQQSLAEAFSQFGQVIEATVVTDRVTNRSKGYGFVKFASLEEAQRAIQGMNGKVLSGRVIYVDTAKTERPWLDDTALQARGPPCKE